MGYLITTDDGRCRICVVTTFAAVSHVKRLHDLGIAFHVTDARGNARDLSEIGLPYSTPAVPAHP